MPKKSPFRDSFAGTNAQRTAAIDAYDLRYDGAQGLAQFHKSFAYQKDAPISDDGPPLARLVGGRGGRGGAARLKTYLTLVWLAERDTRQGKIVWDIDFPRTVIGKLIGAYDDDTGDEDLDRRRDIRVRDQMDRSIKFLHEKELVYRHKHSSRITLLDDRGTGNGYVQPGSQRGVDGQLPKPFPKDQLWFKIPASLWVSGLIGKMTADELAVYLVLSSDLDTGSYTWSHLPAEKWQHIAPSHWTRYIRLTREMRSSGYEKLEERGVIKSRTVPIVPGAPPGHVKKQYLLQPEYDGRIAPPTDRECRDLGLTSLVPHR